MGGVAPANVPAPVETVVTRGQRRPSSNETGPTSLCVTPTIPFVPQGYAQTSASTPPTSGWVPPTPQSPRIHSHWPHAGKQPHRDGDRHQLVASHDDEFVVEREPQRDLALEEGDECGLCLVASVTAAHCDHGSKAAGSLCAHDQHDHIEGVEPEKGRNRGRAVCGPSL